MSWPLRRYVNRDPSGKSAGFTFFEVLVAIAIFSSGIVMIYKAFLVSLDYQTHLKNRLYATNLLTQRIAVLQNTFQASGSMPLGVTEEEHTVELNRRPVDFQMTLYFRSVENLDGVMRLDAAVTWPERTGRRRITRGVYLAKL